MCSQCGYESSKWFGKCPHCGSFDIDQVQVYDAGKGKAGKKQAYTKSWELMGAKGRLGAKTGAGTNASGAGVGVMGAGAASEQIQTVGKILKTGRNFKRITSGFDQVDQVLSGLVPGGVYMLGGEPGVGKSTLALQILGNVALEGVPVVYVSAEESKWQVAMRAKRVLGADQLQVVNILATNNIDKALEQVYAALNAAGAPGVVVFDSMQAFISDFNDGVVGGVSQVKDIIYKIVNFAKQTGTIAIIVGQVTKEGILAGPKLAEHIVDAVAYLEHVDIGGLRLLRAIKNRFGQVGNVGFLTMGADGFRDAPDAYYSYLQGDVKDLTGTTFGVVMYGSRPLVVQVQALLIDSQFANPKRVVEGVGRAKLELLAAVIEKKVPRVSLRAKDIFLKVLGGFNIKDACIDLAIVGALLSAYTGKVFKNTALIGEVGLLGDIRPCGALSMHKKEAKKLGIKKILDSKKIRHVSQLMRGLG